MKKVIRIAALCGAAMAVMAMPTSAYATCGASQPLQHILGMFFTGCPDYRPVQGYAYVLGQEATINTTTTTPAQPSIDIVCEDGSLLTDQGGLCQPEAGVPGDGNVTVSFDWGGPEQTNGAACPNAAGVPGVGRNVIQVVANDGSQVLITVGYSVDFGGYILEMAHPGDGFAPITCSHQNGLTIVSITPGLQGSTVCVVQTAPPIHSDCDAGTGGTAFGNTCQGGTATTPSVAPWSLYTLSGPCGLTPNLLRSGWQPLPTTPGPNGSKCGVINTAPFNVCSFIGGSSIIQGVETGALTGYLQMPCLLAGCAAVDKVQIKKAEVLQGRLRVDFSTENEATIVGFNVYAGGTKLNAGFIQANGTGSNDYSFEVGRGALKSERSITVEAVKSDGATVRSGAVTVK